MAFQREDSSFCGNDFSPEKQDHISYIVSLILISMPGNGALTIFGDPQCIGHIVSVVRSLMV